MEKGVLMHTLQITHSIELDCPPLKAFDGWLDSKIHGAMIDGQADIDPTIGGKFSIWEESIVGKTTLVDRQNLKIEQDWRYEYDDWPSDKPSHISLRFEPRSDGTTVLHFDQCCVPENHLAEIEKGWNEYYWRPMREYFSKS